MRRSLLLAFVLLCLLLTTACWVHSLDPAYDTGDLVAEPGFVGTWVHRVSGSAAADPISTLQKDNTADEYELWTLKAEDTANAWLGPSYDVTFTSQKCQAARCIQTEKPLEWVGHLARIGNYTFLDLQPKDENPDEIHWVPSHTFYRCGLTDGTLAVRFLDDEWLDRAVDQNKVKLAHFHLGSALAGHILLTDDTATIRQFLVDFGNDPDAFPEQNQMVFMRNKP